MKRVLHLIHRILYNVINLLFELADLKWRPYIICILSILFCFPFSGVAKNKQKTELWRSSNEPRMYVSGSLCTNTEAGWRIFYRSKMPYVEQKVGHARLPTLPCLKDGCFIVHILISSPHSTIHREAWTCKQY